MTTIKPACECADRNGSRSGVRQKMTQTDSHSVRAQVFVIFWRTPASVDISPWVEVETLKGRLETGGHLQQGFISGTGHRRDV